MLYVLLVVSPDMIVYWYIFAFIARHSPPSPCTNTPDACSPYHIIAGPDLQNLQRRPQSPEHVARQGRQTADCRSAPYWQGTTEHTARECDDPTISVRHVLSDLPYVLSINTHIYMRVPKLILQQRKDDLLLYAIESET